jgi:hypothetical protein
VPLVPPDVHSLQTNAASRSGGGGCGCDCGCEDPDDQPPPLPPPAEAAAKAEAAAEAEAKAASGRESEGRKQGPPKAPLAGGAPLSATTPSCVLSYVTVTMLVKDASDDEETPTGIRQTGFYQQAARQSQMWTGGAASMNETNPLYDPT